MKDGSWPFVVEANQQLARKDDPLRAIRPDHLRRRRIVAAELVVEAQRLLDDVALGRAAAPQGREVRPGRRAQDRDRDVAALRRPAVDLDVERRAAAPDERDVVGRDVPAEKAEHRNRQALHRVRHAVHRAAAHERVRHGHDAADLAGGRKRRLRVEPLRQPAELRRVVDGQVPRLKEVVVADLDLVPVRDVAGADGKRHRRQVARIVALARIARELGEEPDPARRRNGHPEAVAEQVGERTVDRPVGKFLRQPLARGGRLLGIVVGPFLRDLLARGLRRRGVFDGLRLGLGVDRPLRHFARKRHAIRLLLDVDHREVDLRPVAEDALEPLAPVPALDVSPMHETEAAVVSLDEKAIGLEVHHLAAAFLSDAVLGDPSAARTRGDLFRRGNRNRNFVPVHFSPVLFFIALRPYACNEGILYHISIQSATARRLEYPRGCDFISLTVSTLHSL